MPFIDIKDVEALEVLPGCRLRTPYSENLMLSYLEMDAGAIVPLHDHPHEQGGMLLKGRMELTIGDEVKICEAGSMFLIPPNTPHKAVAVDGPCVVLDVFTPIREDYVELFNKYIPTGDVDTGNAADGE
jgi:quercetin dioxygenase-like cupin family protein